MSLEFHFKCDACLEEATMQSARLPAGWDEITLTLKLDGLKWTQYLCPQCIRAEKYFQRKGIFALTDLFSLALLTLEKPDAN